MARWHFCNVLKPDAASRQLWQFDAVKDGFKLTKEHTLLLGKPLPPHVITKTWDSLWRKKLNVALLPSDKVFLRVLHLPTQDEAEARQIVELQIERLSPLPITQIVWTLHLLPQGSEAARTVIVLIADRSVVEKQLGQLEAEGFLPDRLELPVLDQVLATHPTEDGAWIYPTENDALSLVAWWTDGELRNLAWLNLPEGETREAVLREQLRQMTWAGELEGWLHDTPRFHLVADSAAAAIWQPLFDRWVETPVQVEAPLRPADLASRTARRTAAAQGSLLPDEFAKRYQQQFVDRLWMRGLGAVVVFYILGVLIYFGALSMFQYKLDGAEQKLVQAGNNYSNVVQLKARYEVLRDRTDLKFAALDCWKALADELPEGAVVENMNFTGGRAFTVNGTIATADSSKILDLYERMRKLAPSGKQLFSRTTGEAPVFNSIGGNLTMNSWHFTLNLDRVEQ